jgi:hypothetical protein
MKNTQIILMYKIHYKDKLWFVMLDEKAIASFTTCREAVTLVLFYNSITSKSQLL